MTSDQQRWLERYGDSLLGVFHPSRVLVRGQGAHVWDADGKEYVDFLGGIAVNSLGHAHPALVKAVSEQLATLGHVSNFFASEPQILLAEKLLRLIDAPQGSRVFFSNSGTEANEAAVKLALKSGKKRLLALKGSFHGRTLGALALTYKEAYRSAYMPLPGDVHFVEQGDVAALEAELAAGGVAALFVETIQGELGVQPLPEGYLRAARELTARYGALLVVDEVQTGMGRTGEWFAHRNPVLAGPGAPLLPDVVTLAKGLGGGIPIGATIALGANAAGLLQPGDHGTTFGGNPVAAAAANAVIETIETQGLLAHVRDMGDFLDSELKGLGHPLVRGTRGAGLLRAIVLAEPISARVAAAGLEAGFILNAVSADALRLAPAYVISRADVISLVHALPAMIDAALAASATDASAHTAAAKA